MEITEFMKTLLAICGGITVLIGTCGAIYGVYNFFRKPSTDNSSKIAKHEEEIKDLQEKVQKDYESIEEIKDMQSLLVRSMIELIDNRITGNNIEGLKKIKGEMLQYITDSI